MRSGQHRFARASRGAVIVIAALATSAAPASAATPGTDGLIAYAGAVYGVGSAKHYIAVMNANGTGKRIVVSDGDPDGAFASPTWSPDGTQIAFQHTVQVASDRFASEIVVVKLDGTGLRTLGGVPYCDLFGADNGHAPRWSPDGRLIAAADLCEGTLGLFDAQSGALVSTRAYAGLTGGASWAPDSWRLAIETRSAIKVDNGTTITTVAAAGAQPDWSPDGAAIYYVAARAGHFDIFSVPATGGAPTARTATPTIDEQGPAVSPSGTTLVWGQAGTIVKRPLVGGVLTTLARYGSDPAWQPRAPRPVVGDPMIETTFVPLAADRARVTKFAFAAGASQPISKLRAYVDGRGGTTGAQRLKGVIYADDGGRPGTLVANSSEVTVASGAAPAWRDLTFATPPRLASGVYWLGLLGGPTANLARVGSSSLIKRVTDTAVDAYADGPALTFGSEHTTTSSTTSIFAYGGS